MASANLPPSTLPHRHPTVISRHWRPLKSIDISAGEAAYLHEIQSYLNQYVRCIDSMNRFTK